jgi:hypothetical protein
VLVSQHFLNMIICRDFFKNEVFRSVMAHGPLEVRGSPITVYPNLTLMIQTCSMGRESFDCGIIGSIGGGRYVGAAGAKT